MYTWGWGSGHKFSGETFVVVVVFCLKERAKARENLSFAYFCRVSTFYKSLYTGLSFPSSSLQPGFPTSRSPCPTPQLLCALVIGQPGLDMSPGSPVPSKPSHVPMSRSFPFADSPIQLKWLSVITESPAVTWSEEETQWVPFWLLNLTPQPYWVFKHFLT